MRNLLSILFLGASIGIVVMFVRPTWDEITVLQGEEAKYDEAINRVNLLSNALENQRSLIASIPADDLVRLEKLLPDNVDNVKLIIDINNIAASEGMAIKDIGIATPKDETTAREAPAQSSRAGYDFIDLSFSVSAPYDQFLRFIDALERSLRLVDIISVSFDPSEAGNYNFAVTIRTYWLK